jgi:hypothetical protein
VWWEHARLLSICRPHAPETHAARAKALGLLGLPTIAGALGS